jgi:uncharacterized protein with von Willebrand factor type A (vWA) domain
VSETPGKSAPFADLLLGLRVAGLPVGLTEWMTLMEALQSGVVRPELTDFYRVARAVLIKSEVQFDLYDQVFAAVFGDAEMPTALADQLMGWLENPKELPQLTAEQMAAIEQLPLDKLRELFEQRLKEQDERHDGGNRWVGTGGTSPFGHSGYHPGGIRVGGSGRNRSASQVASDRRFQDYRADRVIDVRQMAVALKKLRRLSRSEGQPELDLDATIDVTCKNGGELELIVQPPRKNQARVLLLMDVGGSMDPHARLVERLFSAANGLGHWRQFNAYTFHNCVYETLFESMWSQQGVPTEEVMRTLDPDTFLIIVGDASMAPTEMVSPYGAIDYWHRNETPGLVWLHRLRKRFNRSVWLNPMPESWWRGYTVELASQLYPMMPLTLDGLDGAIDHLLRGRSAPIGDLDPSLIRSAW